MGFGDDPGSGDGDHDATKEPGLYGVVSESVLYSRVQGVGMGSWKGKLGVDSRRGMSSGARLGSPGRSLVMIQLVNQIQMLLRAAQVTRPSTGLSARGKSSQR
jgi:hypothetical protein